jgi:hypothetical protein
MNRTRSVLLGCTLAVLSAALLVPAPAAATGPGGKKPPAPRTDQRTNAASPPRQVLPRTRAHANVPAPQLMRNGDLATRRAGDRSGFHAGVPAVGVSPKATSSTALAARPPGDRSGITLGAGPSTSRPVGAPRAREKRSTSSGVSVLLSRVPGDQPGQPRPPAGSPPPLPPGPPPQ